MRFDSRTYGFWFVRLSDRLKLGWFRGAVVVALVPYLLGLLLVAPFGDAGLYLRTPAFYIGFAGVLLVMAASVRGVKVFAQGLGDLGEVAYDQARFRDHADEAMKAAAKSRWNLAWLALFMCGATVLVVGALHRWHMSGVVRPGSHFRAFLVEWRAHDNLLPAALSLAVFAVAVAATVGTSAILLVRNLNFAWRLHKFSYMSFPGRVRLGLRKLVTAYVWVSSTWMIGVALFALFFFQSWSALHVVGIVILAALGVLTLGIPYDSFRRILERSHDEMADRLAKSVEQMADGELASPSEFAAVNTAITADPPPVLTRRGLIAYVAVQVIAIGTLFAKDTVQEHVSFLAKESAQPKSDKQEAHRPR